jgi:hypothetical protein
MLVGMFLRPRAGLASSTTRRSRWPTLGSSSTTRYLVRSGVHPLENVALAGPLGPTAGRSPSEFGRRAWPPRGSYRLAVRFASRTPSVIGRFFATPGRNATRRHSQPVQRWVVPAPGAGHAPGDRRVPGHRHRVRARVPRTLGTRRWRDPEPLRPGVLSVTPSPG